MDLRLGDTAPNFTAETTDGAIEFYPWMEDKWAILFSHPADFTPVCTTEFGFLAMYRHEFDRRNVKVIGLSIDTLAHHREWVSDINETQFTHVNFPIIADFDKKIATLYGMIHPNEDSVSTVRSTFLISPAKKIKMVMTYPPTTGRNFEEILRVIDSVQLAMKFPVTTPVNWQCGDDVLVSNDLTPEQLKQTFPKGVTQLRPYLKMTPQPDIDNETKPPAK